MHTYIHTHKFAHTHSTHTHTLCCVMRVRQEIVSSSWSTDCIDFSHTPLSSPSLPLSSSIPLKRMLHILPCCPLSLFSLPRSAVLWPPLRNDLNIGKVLSWTSIEKCHKLHLSCFEACRIYTHSCLLLFVCLPSCRLMDA